MSYRVVWEIEVEDATSPLEAAKIARESQEFGTEALTFEVMDRKTQEVTVVDLLEIEGPEE